MTLVSSRPPLMSLDAAWQALLHERHAVVGTETVPTLLADGRVLAQDVVSEMAVPGFDNSAMDGYAVRVADVVQAQSASKALPVSQRVAAGQSPQALQAASVARIFTGAPLPMGADAVVMQEHTQIDTDEQGQPWVRCLETPVLGQSVRRRGEDVAQGQVILSAGTVLGPAELGLAASVGIAELTVRKRLKVALFSTGDELIMPGDVPPQAMPAGRIYNSNRFFLVALLQRLGCVVSDLGIVPDALSKTTAALRQAAQTHDLVLTSGGVSVGEEDHVKPAVQALGGLDLWQIAIKPGKPFARGWLNRDDGSTCAFVGLPGNPVSSFVTFLVLLRPLLAALQGARIQTLPRPVAMRADFAWPRADKRREFLRVKLNDQGGLDLFSNQSSGVLTSAVWGDGVLDNPPGMTFEAGATVAFLPWSALLTL